MKKMISIALAAIMMLAAMALLAVPASAIVEGDWVTSRAADDYQDEESYRPACGYHYEVDKGLILDTADYTNNTPYTHVHTKKTYNLKEPNADGKGNSVSVEFTVLDFAYGGDDSKDHWVSFSLHSKEVFAPGQTGFGEGVSVLIRGDGNGSATAQFFSLDDNNGYKLFSQMMITIPTNDQGQEVYNFEVKHSEGRYTFYLCGQEFKDVGATADEVLNNYCADGAYVGMSFYTGVTGTPIKVCVNKFQGEVPYGEDSAEPEENLNNFAPIENSDSVPAGQPALIWNSAKEQFKDFKGSNLDFAINEDGTVRATAKTENGYLIFSPKVAVSYEAADFPVIAVLTRNCYAESGTIYYSAGDVMGAQPNCSCEIDIAEIDYGEGWCMGMLDLTDDLDWKGRVNMIRCDFNNIDITDEELKNFDIAYIAAFRTIDDAKAYAQAYLIDLLSKMPETEAPATKPDTEGTTAQIPEGSETEADTNNVTNHEQTTKDQTSGGCGAVVAMPVLTIVTILGSALLISKKH